MRPGRLLELPLQGSNLDFPDPESGVLPVTPRGSSQRPSPQERRPGLNDSEIWRNVQVPLPQSVTREEDDLPLPEKCCQASELTRRKICLPESSTAAPTRVDERGRTAGCHSEGGAAPNPLLAPTPVRRLRNLLSDPSRSAGDLDTRGEGVAEPRNAELEVRKTFARDRRISCRPRRARFRAQIRPRGLAGKILRSAPGPFRESGSGAAPPSG
jgi:hypothetical protein